MRFYAPNGNLHFNNLFICVFQLNVQQANANRSTIGQQGPLTAVVAAPVSMGISVSQNMNMNAAIANMTNNQNAFSNVAQAGRWQVQQEMAVIESLGIFNFVLC